MEGMLTFTGIIIIVFGILQIILFFKLWGMTDNVTKIKNKFTNNNDDTTIVWDIRLYILKGEKDKANNLLFDYFITEIKKIQKEYNDNSFTTSEILSKKIQNTKKNFKNYYNQINVPFPTSLENINTLEDVNNIFKL